MLRTRVIEFIDRSLDQLGAVSARPPVRIEYARDEKFGDYACTIAMDRAFRDVYAALKPEFKNPRNFAEAIVRALQSDPAAPAFFEEIDIAGAGFINLKLAPAALFEEARAALANRAVYGESKRAAPRKIIFEFVSANPTGPLNVVSARAAALGDSCCNLLTACGDEVYREFYVNDYGNQVNLLGLSCLLRALELAGCTLKFSQKRSAEADAAAAHEDEAETYSYPDGPGLRFPAGGYHGEYIINAVRAAIADDPALQPAAGLIEELRARSRAEDLAEDFLSANGYADQAETFGRAVMQRFIASQRADLERFRVRFDNFYSERSLHESGAVLAAAEALGEHVFALEGKRLFRSTEYGDDKDRVIVRADGRPTYLLADIAYHKTKLDRGFDQILNIWGPDHHGYIKRLAGAVQALGANPEQFRVLIAQQVNLLDRGEEVKMSKRAGKLTPMSAILDEIPVDVSRYFFVMRSFDAHLDYDLSEARDTSEKNPYYYAAYAHARIRSIFRKAAERGLVSADADPGKWAAADGAALTPERRRLLALAARFPEEVADAASALEPHRLITFLYELASALSRFYGPRENRVIEQSPETAAILLAILDAVSVCLKNGLRLLGMEAPESMTREIEGEGEKEGAG